MKRNQIVLVCLLGLSAFALKAQTVTIDGEIRPRVEYRDGYAKPLLETNDPGVFAVQRTRLNLSYATGVLNTLITFQDARTFGQTASSSDVATTGIYEAWAEMLLVPGGTVKIGRQALKYDDSRLFSAPAWSNTGTSHDVALFKYCVNDFQGHLGFAYNNNAAMSSETFYTVGSKYRYMGFLWLSKDLFKGLNLSAIGVDEGVQTATNATDYGKEISMNHAYTFGGNLKYQHSSLPLTALATAYFQAGKNSTGSKMAGKMAALKVEYNLSSIFSANAGADYFSGDDRSTDAKQSNFKKLYGADHSLNGYMDYWDTPLTQGLLDYYGGLTAKVVKSLSVEGTFHLFNTDKQLRSGTEEVGRDLGSEVDLILNYKMNPQTVLQVGWSHYFITDNTLLAKGIAADAKIRTPQWAYVMLTVKPAFFSSAPVK
ncbi:MAG: alginate export family protein [Bacteroidales bacterium]|nr:alginate export family protein [Bacteroidales bacterium]